MSVSSIHKFACGCECIEYLDMNGETFPDMERCKEHYSYFDKQVKVLKNEVERLTAEGEFRKEQIAELFDKQEEISRMAHQQEREVWATFILNSQIVRDEWDKVRGERSEFSADDAGLLIESALRDKAHDIQAARLALEIEVMGALSAEGIATPKEGYSKAGFSPSQDIHALAHAARMEGALAVLADAGVSQYIPFRMEGELANRIASSIVKHLEDRK